MSKQELGLIDKQKVMQKKQRFNFTPGNLILSRRPGESVIIDDNITVTIYAVKGNMVRIGINAPKETPVCREETYNKIINEEKSEIKLNF